MIEFILYTTFAHSNMCNEEPSNTQDMQLSGDAPSISSRPQPSLGGGGGGGGGQTYHTQLWAQLSGW
jgi:hypothetical protein